MRLKLKHKLGAGVSAILLCSSLVGGYNIVNLDTIQNAQTEMLEDQYASVSTLLGMKGELSESRRALLESVVDQQVVKKDYEVSDIEEAIQKAASYLESYAVTTSTPEEEMLYNEINEMFGAYIGEVNHMINILKENKQIDHNDNERLEEEYKELIKKINLNITNNMQDMKDVAAESLEAIHNSRTVTIWGTIAAIIVSAIGAYILVKSILKNTNKILRILDKASQGELTQQIEEVTSDELGDIACAANGLIQSLADVTREIMIVSGEVATSSEELLSSAEENDASVEQVTLSIAHLADGAVSQVEAIQEIDTNIISMAKHIDEVSENALYVNQSAEKMVDIAGEGIVQSKKASETIEQIKEATDHTSQVINELGAKSEKIGEIVGVIKGLAGQTNLLALNAAIEAARAGENGKGFAVVADEVKVLAEQSAASAEEIAQLINSIQVEMKAVTEAMAESAKEVNVGVEVVEIASKSFAHIADEIEVVVKQIADVNEAAVYLKQNSSEVVESIRTVREVVEESSASTQEISAASEEQKHSMQTIVEASEDLAQLANKLQCAVNRFKVSE